MTQRLTPSTALLLTLPPLLWAGNAVAGRLMNGLVPPMTLNLLRWVIALVLLWPLAGWVARPGSGLWQHGRRFALLGFLGVGVYNALQYLALKTSTPLNVTLVAASSPVFMLLVGLLFFGQPVGRRQWLGAALSITGVLFVIARGDWATLLAVRLVPGDLYVLVATAAWAWYSWLLGRTTEPEAIRNDWAALLLAQIVTGLPWAAALSMGEWTLFSPAPIAWSLPVLAGLAYVALGPAIVAYRCWGIGVQRAGPALAGFFGNLTPLFAAIFSAAFLGELPHWYHGMAFALIVGGIVVSSRR